MALNGHLLPQPIVSVNKIIRSIFFDRIMLGGHEFLLGISKPGLMADFIQNYGVFKKIFLLEILFFCPIIDRNKG